jgi:hypothetical protein
MMPGNRQAGMPASVPVFWHDDCGADSRHKCMLSKTARVTSLDRLKRIPTSVAGAMTHGRPSHPCLLGPADQAYRSVLQN